MKKKYIIFDFDGTIANTNDVIIETWKATFKRFHGYEIETRKAEVFFGETLRDTVTEQFPDYEYEEVRDYYRDYQDNNSTSSVYVFPGVGELIETLKQRGHKIGIATSRTTNSLGRYLRRLGIEHFPDVIVAMEDVTKHKPDPESVIKTLEKFGANPDEAIMLGDIKYDIGSANAAGVDSVLIGWSHYVDEDAMQREGFVPTHKIAKPEELLKII